jgi:hypothetical protein
MDQGRLRFFKQRLDSKVGDVFALDRAVIATDLPQCWR